MMTESKIDVRYPDCDPMGIVHHGVYPLWYEIARMDYFAAVGYGYTDMNASGINPPMVNLNLNYFSPVRYPGSVTVRTVCTLVDGKKLELKYNVYPEGQSTPCATATSFHIWTGPDMKSLDMRTLPEVYPKLAGNVTRPAVLILSGGRSSRMGRDKSLISLEGKTMLERAVDFWREVMPGAKLYVSVGPADHYDTLPEGVTPVADRREGLGPMEGIRSAFLETGEELFVVSAVDMPLLKKEAYDLLNRKRHHCEDICVFRGQDGPEPLFGFYRSTCLPVMERLLEQQDRRMSALLSQAKTTFVPLPETAWVTNVNTPEDLQKIN